MTVWFGKVQLTGRTKRKKRKKRKIGCENPRALLGRPAYRK
jgi:hypothetical protein